MESADRAYVVNYRVTKPAFPAYCETISVQAASGYLSSIATVYKYNQ